MTVRKQKKLRSKTSAGEELCNLLNLDTIGD